MIHVDPVDEPEDFEWRVRRPGQSFLATHPQPNGPQWKRHDYWRRASDELYDAYGGICAYTGMFFRKGVNPASVDHFIPKSREPELAYEWSNYRLTTSVMNINKGDSDVVDPFEIADGDIQLALPLCYVKPDPALDLEYRELLMHTIAVLRLNSDNDIVQDRRDIVCDYADGMFTGRYLAERYPFIACELARQGLLEDNETLRQIMHLGP